MSRTKLCTVTAVGLVILSLTLMGGRYQVLGDEALVPRDPRTWKVTMKVNGRCLTSKARLVTLAPPDFERQHIKNESFNSAELAERLGTPSDPSKRYVLWSQRGGVEPGTFSAIYEFYCDMSLPGSIRADRSPLYYGEPIPGEHLQSEANVQTDHAEISGLARRLVTGRESHYDQVSALFRYVDTEISNEPSVGLSALSALECMRNGGGNARAKSRLLVALLRNRGIPARVVTGLALARGREQTTHYWAEAWVREHWMPLCPFYHRLGRVPSTYLVLSYDDHPVVRGKHVQNLNCAFLVEHTAKDDPASAEENVPPSEMRRWVKQLSLDSLPPTEQQLVKFLLLLPLAALIVCIYRNLIGIQSFGTFAPALVGLAFREIDSFYGLAVFAALIVVGWTMRRTLDRYQLLQVPRTSVMLSFVVLVLIGTVVAANMHDLAASKYLPLFPIVILTGMIERFWTLETEDGAWSSLKTLAGTLLIAVSVAVLLSWKSLVHHMFLFPESLGIIIALQLVIGRYTGYRLSELFRFRCFLQPSGQ
ncbi:MAG: 7TM domain-containing protein [Gemmataceae bacterium]